MKYPLIVALSCLTLAWACKNDTNSSEGVQEIKGGNADIVRNPIGADQPLDTTKLARITFEESEYEFGQVNEGSIVTHAFKFKNTGAVPLVINNCRSSCGCTVPEWPKEAIPPGGSGEISARFNSEHKKELQKKIVYVSANTYPAETQVSLHGFVIPKKE